MSIKDIFSYFERIKEEKEKQKKANLKHHNSVLLTIDNFAKYDTRTLSNNDLRRTILDIWNSVEYSATVCGKHEGWADQEYSHLTRLPKDYDLRVEIYLHELLWSSKGDELIDKLNSKMGL